MTLESAANSRGSFWTLLLYDWGYEGRDPFEPRPQHSAEVAAMLAGQKEKLPAGDVRVEAIRSASMGDPHVAISIQERWRVGSDPAGLHPAQVGGCYPQKLSWHAQFVADGAQMGVGAYRFDLDRKKTGARRLHFHPLGLPNKHKTDCVLMDPYEWLADVERLSIVGWPL